MLMEGSLFHSPAEARFGEEEQDPDRAPVASSTRYHTFLSGMQARILSSREKLEADSTSVTYYVIKCVKQGKEWEVEKRYSEFYSLHENMPEMLSPFPPKIIGFKTAVKAVIKGANKQQTDMRMNMLNAWMVNKRLQHFLMPLD